MGHMEMLGAWAGSVGKGTRCSNLLARDKSPELTQKIGYGGAHL